MRILIAALISEGFLLLGAIIIGVFFDLSVPWNFSARALIVGLLLTIPPLFLNQILWRYSDTHPNSIYGRFSREIITPFCRQIDLGTAIIVAILSGTCEEIFFRGALDSLVQAQLGIAASCIITSILFAAVHFIGNFKRYGSMIPLYTAMGTYLWAAKHLTDSVAAVSVIHGLYNFIVIMLVKRTSRELHESQP
jgi:membrane protease YdiL (CAAX protease family)